MQAVAGTIWQSIEIDRVTHTECPRSSLYDGNSRRDD